MIHREARPGVTARSAWRSWTKVVLAVVAVAAVWADGRWLESGTGSPTAVAGPSGAEADWDFGEGVPVGWTRGLPEVRTVVTKGGLDVRTTPGTSEYQLQSSPFVLAGGMYGLRIRAAIRFGGLEVGVLDVRKNVWIATGLFASNQGTATRTIVLPFRLDGQTETQIILSNWMPGEGSSRWTVDGVRLKGGFAVASKQALSNPAALPVTGSALFGTAPAPNTSLAPNLEAVVPKAIDAMQGRGTTWAKATEIRSLVRKAMPPSATCDQVATAYWQVGTRAGLVLRFVVGFANGTNLYDSHQTTEVWLPSERQWVISDATFNGFWSVGRRPVPVGIAALRSYLVSGREGEIYWHQTDSKNAIRPSSYYVDPLALYRYPGVQARVQGTGAYLAWEPAFATFGVYEMPTTDIDRVRPGTPLTVTRVPSMLGSTAAFPTPPPYLEPRPVERRLVVGTNGSGTLRLGRKGVAAVTTAARTGNWVIEQPNGTQFGLTSIGGARLSPMVGLTGRSVVRVIGATPGTYVVRIWATKRFPKARELAA